MERLMSDYVIFEAIETDKVTYEVWITYGVFAHTHIESCTTLAKAIEFVEKRKVDKQYGKL